MTPYTPSLWSQAPEGANYWMEVNGVQLWVKQIEEDKAYGVRGHSYNYFNSENGKWDNIGMTFDAFTAHERPQCFKTPEQLIAEYRKEHGTEIEADAQTFFDSLTEDAQSSKNVLQIDHLLYDAAFHLALFEKYLAAERARIEGAE